ncbi:MAG: aldose epimerase family protein [Phyllobacterium sp.]
MSQPALSPQQSAIRRIRFGILADGRDVDAIMLCNAGGLETTILTYGATVQSLFVPDSRGNRADIVLGHDDLESYVENRRFYGATIGRFANRIGKARFTLDDAAYSLDSNEGENTLHGGSDGFDRVLWQIDEIGDGADPSLSLVHVSPDGAGGYSGTLTTRVRFTLTRANDLVIEYEAQTDKPTVVNLTNHSFFNLGGSDQKTGILDHAMQVNADAFLATDQALIPTGEIVPVAGTPLDFNVAARLRERVTDTTHDAIRTGGGIDHAFCLRGAATSEARLVATLEDPASGRTMQVLTTEPSLQIYTGNRIENGTKGKRGRIYNQHHALCLEAQHYPDSPNRPAFPATRLNPGETYRQTTIYRFPGAATTNTEIE